LNLFAYTWKGYRSHRMMGDGLMNPAYIMLDVDGS